ncbi:hypothetical protein [Pseudarthrobacter sp. 1C304]
MKLSVVVSVDLDHTSVTIRAAGQLSARAVLAFNPPPRASAPRLAA